jgi:hypothetical protein
MEGWHETMKYRIKIFIDASEAMINLWFEHHPEIIVLSVERKNIANPVQSGLRRHKNNWIETIVAYTIGETK